MRFTPPSVPPELQCRVSPAVTAPRSRSRWRANVGEAGQLALRLPRPRTRTPARSPASPPPSNSWTTSATSSSPPSHLTRWDSSPASSPNPPAPGYGAARCAWPASTTAPLLVAVRRRRRMHPGRLLPVPLPPGPRRSPRRRLLARNQTGLDAANASDTRRHLHRPAHPQPPRRPRPTVTYSPRRRHHQPTPTPSPAATAAIPASRSPCPSPASRTASASSEFFSSLPKR